MRGLFVTGTDTGVGKTIVTAGIARLLADEGHAVGVMKPVETGHPSDDGWPADAGFLALAARTDDPRELVVPFTYSEPLAPLVAARREVRPVDLDAIDAAAAAIAARHDLVLVEGAGGISVPVTDDTDMAGLALRLGLPVLVVARPDLGTLNHTLLTVRYARARGLRVAGVVLCGGRGDAAEVAERTNPPMLEEMCGVPVLGIVPRFGMISGPEKAKEAVAAALAPARILALVDETEGSAP